MVENERPMKWFDDLRQVMISITAETDLETQKVFRWLWYGAAVWVVEAGAMWVLDSVDLMIQWALKEIVQPLMYDPDQTAAVPC